MPTSRASVPRAFTRRDGLRALALLGPAALVAACTQEGEPAPSSSAVVPSGVAVDESAAAQDEAALVARYAAVLTGTTGVPESARVLLESIRDQHAAHLDALGGADAAPVPSPPPDWVAARTSLIAAEREASASRIRDCVEASDAERARILALIGASEAAHVPALRDVGA